MAPAPDAEDSCGHAAFDRLSGLLCKFAATKDVKIFTTFLTSIEPQVDAFLKRRIVIDQDHMRDDIKQELFIRLLLKSGSYDCSRSAVVWTLVVVKNVLIDMFRSQRRRPLSFRSLLHSDDESAEANSTLYEPVSRENTPVEIAIQHEDEAFFSEEIARLPEDERIAMIHFHTHGRSYREIAKQMNASVPQVTNYLYRARQRLARSKRTGGKKLYVASLSYEVLSADLEALFGPPPPQHVRVFRVAAGLAQWTDEEKAWLITNPRWHKYEQDLKATLKTITGHGF